MIFAASSRTELLRRVRIGTGKQAIIESVALDAPLCELPFEPFVAIETDLGVEGKVRAELDEEGPKALSTM